MKKIIIILCTIFLYLVSVCPLGAVPIFDQGFESLQPPWTGAGVYIEQQLAQTFTVGIAGTLSRIDVNMFKEGAPSTLDFEIRSLVGGLPGVLPESSLFSTSYLPSDVTGTSITDPAFLSTDVSIPVEVGDQLAIVLTSPGSGYEDWYNWAGVYYQNPYPQGAAYLKAPGGNFRDLAGGVPADFSFRTYVAPVPEPSTLLLLGAGLIGLAGWGRRKFKKDIS